MSDRLKDLQRQRALAQEQVAWLDREIARETAGTTQVPSLSAVASAKAEPRNSPEAAATPDADKIIAQYQGTTRSVHSEVKRGCFIYFFAAFALVGLGVLALYFMRPR